jgi:hypothetical protein
LDLTEQNILYYADLAEYHTIYGLKHMRKKNLARLYLICYVFHRYQKINDYLIFSFNHKVNRYIADAEEHQNKAYEDFLSNENKDRNSVADILALLVNKNIVDNELRNKAYDIVPKEFLPNLIRKFRKPQFNAEFHRWQYYAQTSASIKQNLRASFIYSPMKLVQKKQECYS